MEKINSSVWARQIVSQSATQKVRTQKAAGHGSIAPAACGRRSFTVVETSRKYALSKQTKQKFFSKDALGKIPLNSN
jgi:hypothetical protein